MFISIIIPTYNRAQYLPLTIDSFINQNYPRDKFEIIIANNNSSDTTEKVVSEIVSRSPIKIKYIFEKRQGVHYARNTAAKLAGGDILYFTDDDMLADSNLLQEIIKPFSLDPKIACVTGKVLPKWEAPPPKWILELCSNYLLSLIDKEEDLLVSPYDCGVYSCHQAIKREAFFNSGGFNPENTAGEWIGDGETGLNIKIKELGYKFSYIGKSIIYHMIPASRLTQSYLNRRMANTGNCDSYTEYRKLRPSPTKLHMNSFYYLFCIFFNLFMVILYLLFLNTKWRLCLARLFYFKNRIIYDYKLARDNAWRELVLKYDWLNE